MTSSSCSQGANSLAAGEKHKSKPILIIRLIFSALLEGVQIEIIKEQMHKM